MVKILVYLVSELIGESMKRWIFIIAFIFSIAGALYSFYLAVFWGWAGATPGVDYTIAERYFQIFGIVSLSLLGVSVFIIVRLWQYLRQSRNNQKR